MDPPDTQGKSLWDTLLQSLQVCQHGVLACTDPRAPIVGVTPQGTLVGGMTVDAFFGRVNSILVESQQIYRWQDTICYETNGQTDQRLFVIASRQKAEPNAASLLANLLYTVVHGEYVTTEALLAPK